MSGDPKRYIERVIDRLGLVESPASDRVFVTEQKRDELREQQLAGVEELTEAVYEDMGRERKIEYLRRRLRARAENSSRGTAAVTYREVRDDLFNGLPCDSHTYTLVEKAAEDTDQYRHRTVRGEIRLLADLRWAEPEPVDEDAPESDPGAVATAFGSDRETTLEAAVEAVRGAAGRSGADRPRGSPHTL